MFPLLQSRKFRWCLTIIVDRPFSSWSVLIATEAGRKLRAESGQLSSQFMEGTTIFTGTQLVIDDL